MNKQIHVKPQFYSLCYYRLKEIALKYGYNLLIHGSLNRDFDLVAVPWSEELKPYVEMINEFVSYLGGHVMPELEERRIAFANSHYGRAHYVINLNRGGGETNYEDPKWYVDISIFLPLKNL